MRSKGAIRLLAILLALVSVYQLSFTWITNGVRDDAAEYAESKLETEKAYNKSHDIKKDAAQYAKIELKFEKHYNATSEYLWRI